MKFYLILVSLISLCLGCIPAVATTENEWSVTIYDEGTGALVQFSDSGQLASPLPDFSLSTINATLTNDQHYFVALVERSTSTPMEAVIVDLFAHETIPVEIPPLEREEKFCGYGMGAFKPTMDKIALPYISDKPAMGGGGCDSGGIAVIDLTTGTVVHTLDIDATYHQSTAWVDDWTDEGIWFAPTCSACTPAYTFTYLVWQPETDAILTTHVFHDWANAERLRATGELLYSESRTDFPLGPGILPFRNTVVIYQEDEYPPNTPGQVVFYDVDYLGFDSRTHWIMNGAGFVVTKDHRHNMAVFRDGHPIRMDYDQPEDFLAMTGDGWLTFDPASRQVKRYQVSDEQITGRVIYQASGEVYVANIQTPPKTFPAFAIHIAPPDVFFLSRIATLAAGNR